MSAKKIKLIINIITICAFTLLIVLSRHQITAVFDQLDNLNLWILGSIIPLQIVNFYAVGKIYSTYFASHGQYLPNKLLHRISYEINFVNHVFPSGGISGFSYLTIRLKQYGIRASQSTMAQVVRFVMTFLSFLILLLFGVFALALGNQANGLIILISAIILMGIIFGTGLAIFIISSEKRIKAMIAWLPKLLNRMLKPFHRRQKDIIDMARVERVLENFHEDYTYLSRDKAKLKQPFIWAFVANCAEILTVVVVYWALGDFVNPGAVILAYAVANFAGLVAILPGGIGVYESLMAIVLTAAGVPGALALSSTLIYRVLTILLFLPPGFLLYHLALNHKDKQPPGNK